MGTSSVSRRSPAADKPAGAKLEEVQQRPGLLDRREAVEPDLAPEHVAFDLPRRA